MHALTCAIGALGGAGLLGLVSVANFAEGPFFSLSTNTWPVERDGTTLVGGVQGAIKAADRGTATLRVASGFLGLWSVAIVITEDTEIPVGDKLGGIGDLDRGQLVRVAYEVRDDHLVARRVDVLDRGTKSDVGRPVATPADPRPKVVPWTPVPFAVSPKPLENVPSRRTAAAPRAASPPKPEKSADPSKKRPPTLHKASPRTNAANASRSTPAQSRVSGVPRTADSGSAALAGSRRRDDPPTDSGAAAAARRPGPR